MIHQEYYKSILHRDIIERFNAIHPQAVVQAGYRLICSAASLYSINRITNYLKSLGYKGHEVDFIWLDNKGKRNLVQVCLSLKDPLTKKRAISSLIEAMNELGFRKSTLITLEEENIIQEGNKIIEVVPVWKYIL